MSGRFFLFEGLDGSGKSTQCRMLAEALMARGYTLVQTREPTDGPWGRKIREMASSGQRVAPEQELDWFVRDRKEHIEQLLGPALARGDVIIQDRYFFSTMAYQGSRGLDPQQILELHLEFAPLPHRTFLLEIPAETGLQRIQSRQQGLDAFEKLSSLQKCAQIFADLHIEGLVRLDGTADIEELHQQILGEALECLGAPEAA